MPMQPTTQATDRGELYIYEEDAESMEEKRAKSARYRLNHETANTG